MLIFLYEFLPLVTMVWEAILRFQVFLIATKAWKAANPVHVAAV